MNLRTVQTTFSRYLFVATVLTCVIGFSSCKNATLYHRASTTQLATNAGSLQPKIDLSIPYDTLDTLYYDIKRKSAIAGFYRDRDGKPAWLINEKTTNHCDSLVSFLNQIRYYGLSPSRYHSTEINEQTDKKSITAKQLLELLLTDAYIMMHQELRRGISARHDRDHDSTSVADLRVALEKGNVINSLVVQQPDHAGYKLLINHLRDLLDTTNVVEQDSTINREKIVTTIAVNLERWRRETMPWENWKAVVNIPSFMIHVIESSDTVLSSRVIVGKPDHQTPEITSLIECFTLYPYWHVPRKISVEEYLPVIQKDTSFISKNNFDVLDRKGNILDPAKVPWVSYHKNNFPVVLRQREGTDNALGLIKFTFDNPYAVYLHDTNAKRLFRNSSRALSHGCIRMEKAEMFAHYLMTRKAGKQSRFVRNYLDTKTRIVINLPDPIKLYVRYFTAEVVAGNLRVYPDVYGYDRIIIEQWTLGNNGNAL
jgi:murein L,D-transpeptidase YcbB/YkuD